MGKEGKKATINKYWELSSLPRRHPPSWHPQTPAETRSALRTPSPSAEMGEDWDTARGSGLSWRNARNTALNCRGTWGRCQHCWPRLTSGGQSRIRFPIEPAFNLELDLEYRLHSLWISSFNMNLFKIHEFLTKNTSALCPFLFQSCPFVHILACIYICIYRYRYTHIHM